MNRLKLNPAQLKLLQILAKNGPELSSGMMEHHATFRNTRQLLIGLRKRGFLVDRWKGRYHMWSLGPMADELKDMGLLE